MQEGEEKEAFPVSEDQVRIRGYESQEEGEGGRAGALPKADLACQGKFHKSTHQRKSNDIFRSTTLKSIRQERERNDRWEG